jgi:hypothetical protein
MPEDKKPQMKYMGQRTWEYKAVMGWMLSNMTLEKICNDLGLSGWEVVGFTKEVVLFKREILF